MSDTQVSSNNCHDLSTFLYVQHDGKEQSAISRNKLLLVTNHAPTTTICLNAYLVCH